VRHAPNYAVEQAGCKVRRLGEGERGAAPELGEASKTAVWSNGGLRRRAGRRLSNAGAA
ncbi:hypothetical protein FS749_009580, partial [Ceratobasidium sp. UAMH 11750]